MEEKRVLYLFFRDREEGVTQNMIERNGEEGTRNRFLENTLMQMRREGFPVPEGTEVKAVLPTEWVGELEAQISTSVDILTGSIDWWFEEKGYKVITKPYAYMGEAPRQFWVGYQAMLPLWVTLEKMESTEPAEPAEIPPTEEAADPSGEKDSAAPEEEHVPDRPIYGSNALEDLREKEEGHSWRDVYVFISSTFNDMHGERNYLVKRVFPELSQWCASHRLRLRDIDLRWGITEEDSQENKKTVEICLDNIDRCRPFFLCFIGQRRGWVPTPEDIAEHTFDLFPKLKENLGCSVTEMEVIHSLIDPMRRQNLSEQDSLERAFFYLRDGAYLQDIRSEKLIDIYTNRSSADPDKEDALLREFREKTIPDTQRPYHPYTCRWDRNGKTPELSAIKGATPDIVEGQLTDFQCEGRPLAEQIIEDLKTAITERYGLDRRREEDDSGDDLLPELEEQALFLYTAGEAFIERDGDLSPFESYVNDSGTKPLLLTAPAGMGKSSLLAHWILKSGYKIYYRFIGRSQGANTAVDLIYSLWKQFRMDGKTEKDPPQDPAGLLEGFAALLEEASKENRLVLVIDAIDQLPGGVQDAAFLPQTIPPDVRLIVSVKEDAPGADRYLREAVSYAEIIHVRPLSDVKDRDLLVETYLSNYLKKLGDSQKDALIMSPGAENPLYLKIVLNELRVFGAYDTLQSHIENDFGDTPQTAFDAMLSRLETDTIVTDISMKELARNVFGWMAHARYGMDAHELAEMLVRHGTASDIGSALDAVHVLHRGLREFLTEREGRIDFFYDSFREAAIRRYTQDKPSEAWHSELAAFLAGKDFADPHRLLEQAYQLVRSGQENAYLDYVMDIRYLRSQLARGGVQALQKDYALMETPETGRMSAFLSLCGTVLLHRPDQLMPRLAGHLSGCGLPRVQKLLSDAEQSESGRWLKPLLPCFEEPVGRDDRMIVTRESMQVCVALLREDTLAAAIVDGSMVSVWNLENNSVEMKIPADKGRRFICLSAADNGRKLVVSSADAESWGGCRIHVFETEGFRCILTFPIIGAGTSYYYYGIFHMRPHRFMVEGDVLALPDEAHLIAAYSLTDGHRIAAQKYRWNAQQVVLSENGLLAAVNIHPQNAEKAYDTYAFQRIANPAYLFRLDQTEGSITPYGKPVGEWKSSVETAALSPDGRLLAGSDLLRVCVYRTDTGEKVFELPDREINVLSFLKKKNLLLVAGQSFSLYDTEDFHLVKEIRGLGRCHGIAFSADESFAALRVDERKIRVVSLEEEDQSGSLAGVPAPIRSTALSEDGAYVLASCYDNMVQSGKERTFGLSEDPRLYVLERETGFVKNQLRCKGRNNWDFTFVMPDGSGAASTQFQDKDWYIYKYWALPKGELLENEELYVEKFSQKKTRSYDLPDAICFSADRQHVIIRDSSYQPVCVYRTKTGRFLGKVTLKLPVSGLKKLFAKKAELEMHMGDAYFDVADGGESLYVFFGDYQKPRVEKYDIRKDKLIFSRPLSGTNPCRLVHTNYENHFCRVVDNGSRMVVVLEEGAAVISLATGSVVFYLDKREAGCSDDDYFAACSADGRFLAISGKEDYKDVNWKLQLYDIESESLLAEFVADGEIGEICFEEDQQTILFGMGNGRICRLRLI